MMLPERQHTHKQVFGRENDSNKHDQQSSTNDFSNSDSPLKNTFYWLFTRWMQGIKPKDL